MSWSQALAARFCPPALVGLLVFATALPPVRADEVLPAGAPKVRLLFPLLGGDEFRRILPLAPRATLEQINGESYVLIGEFSDARVAHRLGRSIQTLLRLPFDLAYDPGHPQLDLAWLRDESTALARTSGTAAAVQATASAMVALPGASTADQAASPVAANQAVASQVAADPEPASPLPAALQGARALLGDTPLQIGMSSLLSGALPAAAPPLVPAAASASVQGSGGSAAPPVGPAAKIALPAPTAGTPDPRSADAVPALGRAAGPSAAGPAVSIAAAAARVAPFAAAAPETTPAHAARTAAAATPAAVQPAARAVGLERPVGSGRAADSDRAGGDAQTAGLAQTAGSSQAAGSAGSEGFARTTASAAPLAPVVPAVTTAAVAELGSGPVGVGTASSIARPAAGPGAEVIAAPVEERAAFWIGRSDGAALPEGPQVLGPGAADRTFLVSRLAPVSNTSVDYLFVVLDNAAELEELDGIVPLREVTLYQGRMLARIGIYTRSLRGRLLLERQISQLRQRQLRLMVARGGEPQLLS